MFDAECNYPSDRDKDEEEGKMFRSMCFSDDAHVCAHPDPISERPHKGQVYTIASLDDRVVKKHMSKFQAGV